MVCSVSFFSSGAAPAHPTYLRHGGRKRAPDSISLVVRNKAGREGSKRPASHSYHTFSYDQCNPPPGTLAIVASSFVERTASGVSLRELVRAIEVVAEKDSDLVMKLLSRRRSAKLSRKHSGFGARRGLQHRLSTFTTCGWFRRSAVVPPAGVSEIHFRSDLSGVPVLALKTLASKTGRSRRW
jgi:hypothetical protein